MQIYRNLWEMFDEFLQKEKRIDILSRIEIRV